MGMRKIKWGRYDLIDVFKRSFWLIFGDWTLRDKEKKLESYCRHFLVKKRENMAVETKVMAIRWGKKRQTQDMFQ